MCLTEDDLMKQPSLVTDSINSNQNTNKEITPVYTKDNLLGSSSTFTPKSTSGDGCCGEANPYVPYNIAIVVLCLDIFLPGIGTLVSAYYDPNGCNCKTITCGIFQLILTPILVGWIWSIIQGTYIYKKSKIYNEQLTLNA